MRIRYLRLIILLGFVSPCLSQEVRFLQIGSLHSWFRADGSESETGRTGRSAEMIDGLQWPAFYANQDCQVSKGLWIGAKNYRDPAESGGKSYNCKVIHCGPRYAGAEDFIPIEFKLTSRFPFPQVSVDGRLDERLSTTHKLDGIDPGLSCDQMITTIVNTSLGVTMERKIMAWTNPGHDNYYIHDYTFTNSGNTDADPMIEQQQTLEGVYFYFTFKYAMTKEAIFDFSNGWLPHSSLWGMSTMLDARGENPSDGDEFRAVFSWLGKHSQWGGPGDNIGAPAYLLDGHLGAAQYAGVITLHADKSADDQTDDPWQPHTTQYMDSDGKIFSANDTFDSTKMAAEYAAMTAGHPAIRHADAVGDGFADQYGGVPGGYLHAVGYGPYVITPGQSIHIVLAEGVSGLSREQCFEVGERWLTEKRPYILPDKLQTDDRNEYKNKWVYTGRDSLFKTFRHALSNYRSSFSIPSPPPPPNKFIITSGIDRISLQWSDDSEADPRFAGYQIYRNTTENQQLVKAEKIFECGEKTAHMQIIHAFDDFNTVRGMSYYYYIQALNNGNNNGGMPLPSSLFWTATSEPAYLRASIREHADLYVSPFGNDQNSGLSAAVPLKTIHAALAKIGANFVDPHIIHLAPGLYSPSATGEKFPLDGQHYITIRGADKASTILCPEDSAWAFYLGDGIQGFTLDNLTIEKGSRKEGGAVCSYSDLTLKNVVIYRNAGIGLYFIGRDKTLSLQNTAVRENGRSGITIWGPAKVSLLNTAITDNLGTGLSLGTSQEVIFDANARCNIYRNIMDIARSFQTKANKKIAVFVDTFTVAYPSPYHARPPEGFVFNILHTLEEQTAADLYVSATGNDANSGTSPDQPLRTIEHAIRQVIADSSIRRTIHLADGRYSASTMGENFPLLCPSWITLSGSATEKCIMDGEGKTSNGLDIYGAHVFELNNLTVTGFTYWPLRIQFCDKIELSRLAIVNNSGSGSGSSLQCYYSDQVRLINTTIAGNRFGSGTYYGGINTVFSSMDIINSIIWANFPHQFISLGSTTKISSSDIDTTDTSKLWSWLDGNKSADPGFQDPEHGDYRLRPIYTCVDAGTAFFADGVDTLVNMGKNDYKGSAPDIGAFESDLTLVYSNRSSGPLVFALAQNYPNPFNASTELCYEVPCRSAVKIELYNILGQKAASLVDAVQPAGRFKIVINADILASGLYICRMQAGQHIIMRKMAIVR